MAGGQPIQHYIHATSIYVTGSGRRICFTLKPEQHRGMLRACAARIEMNVRTGHLHIFGDCPLKRLPLVAAANLRSSTFTNRVSPLPSRAVGFCCSLAWSAASPYQARETSIQLSQDRIGCVNCRVSQQRNLHSTLVRRTLTSSWY